MLKKGKGGPLFAKKPAPIPADRPDWPINQVGEMILTLPVSLKDICRLGKNFPWPRPDKCPRCGHPRLWAHGFVLAFFDCISGGALLRRWRCPECGGVYRMKPCGYFPRFQARADKIRYSLSTRLTTGFWPPGLSRGRQGHWLRSLKRQAAAWLGIRFLDRLLEAFDLLMAQGRIPVSRSI